MGNDKIANSSVAEELRRYVCSEEFCSVGSDKAPLLVANHFAEWQKERMAAGAVEGWVTDDFNKDWLQHFGLAIGDKVKIIVLKEE